MYSRYFGKFQIIVPPEFKNVWILETISSYKLCATFTLQVFGSWET